MKKVLLVLIMLYGSVFAQEVLDRVVAVVDNEVILQSELDFRVQIEAAKLRIDPSSPELKAQILDQMITEKLFYAQAILDSVMVSANEINGQVDYQVQYLLQQYGSKENLEKLYGRSLEKIKRELRPEVEKQIMVKRLREKKFGQIEASRRQVEDFFYTFKDSLGMIPEKVKIAHIYKNPKMSDRLKARAYEVAKTLLDSIKNGADFGELAKKFSEDPGSASTGGDLGFVKRGIFYSEFESAAFALKEGELSDVVESPVGFHIIQLLEKRGESIHTRHILIKVKADNQTDLDLITFLSDVRDSIMLKDNTFEYYAKLYSDDKETSVFGGVLGTYYIDRLDPELLATVSKLKQGEISAPKRIDYSADNYGYHIVKLIERVPQHKPDLELDYDELKNLTVMYLQDEMEKTWLEEIKQNVFWEIKL
ncbi:MAG: peptidylprolyl isomerase [Ignavibacteriaceae bacterium]|nr:peptidylprolyl isomerase [Ignavibacteriaceae bacterium]NUM70903.1 peptidylprolyl isomerase [Ignavibacteriaceae bacterium]